MKTKIIIEMQGHDTTIPVDLETRVEALVNSLYNGWEVKDNRGDTQVISTLRATDGKHEIFHSEQSGDINVKIKLEGRFD